MKFTIFQHVPYESPGFILDWITSKGYTWQEVNFYGHPELPALKAVDNLIIMGGPMNIYDDDEFSWLPDERDYLKQFMQTGKKVFGICLGAQLIADALGANVYKNEHVEIGWFKVKVDQDRLPKKLAGVFPYEFVTLHWHGDTFEMPQEIKSFASSRITKNQAFVFKNVAALQFHMEITQEGLTALIEQNQSLLGEDLPYVQRPGQMLHLNENHETNREILYRFLNQFFDK